MTFVTAWLAAAGLAAMAVPILIHLLLRRRREPVPWAAMRLLREVLREQTRRLRLEQWIVLALRCLLLAAVGAAVAQPLLRGTSWLEGSGGRLVVLVVDDGLLSGLIDDGGSTALQRQVQVADSILDALAPSDAVGLITASRPAQGRVLPAGSSPAAVSAILRSLVPSDAPTDIPGALALLREAIDRVPEDRPVAVVLLSDFRQGSADLGETMEPLLAGSAGSAGRRLELLATPPAESAVDNVQVTALTPLRRLLLPGQSDGSGQVTVRLRRFGALPEGASRLRIGGTGIGQEGSRGEQLRTVRWEEGRSEAVAEILLEDGEAAGAEGAAGRGAMGIEVRLDGDALPADDRRVAVLQTRRTLRVALVDRRVFGALPGFERLGAGQWLARALRPSDAAPIEVLVEDPTRLDAGALRGVDAAVVARPDLLDAAGWEALGDLLGRGGMVLVVPPGEQRVHGWLDRLTTTFRVPWRPELEAVDVAAPLPLAENQPSTPLLKLLEGELSELIAPVRILRRIPIDVAGATDDLVLVAADGSPVVLATNPRMPSEVRGADQPSQPASAASSAEVLPGQLVLLSVAPELDWTDLPLRPAMVPLIQELVRQGVGLGGRSSEILVGERVAAGPSAVELAVVQPRRLPGRGGSEEGDQTRVPVRGGRSEPVERSGLYAIVDGAGQEAGLVAVNIEPGSGDPTPQASEAVLNWLRRSGPWKALDAADPAAPLALVESSSALSGVLLAIALLAALLECYFARRFSHATVRASADAAVGPGGPRPSSSRQIAPEAAA